MTNTQKKRGELEHTTSPPLLRGNRNVQRKEERKTPTNRRNTFLKMKKKDIGKGSGGGLHTHTHTPRATQTHHNHNRKYPQQFE
jgi:hypothetical protein